MTENPNDPYLERYRQLRKAALANGLGLRYSRRRLNIVDILLDEAEGEEGALTGKERLVLVDVGDHSTVWVSSFTDGATVFQEGAVYLRSLDPNDPGIARAAYARKVTQEMVGQIVTWAKEMVGADD